MPCRVRAVRVHPYPRATVPGHAPTRPGTRGVRGPQSSKLENLERCCAQRRLGARPFAARRVVNPTSEGVMIRGAHTGACIYPHAFMPTGGAHARPRAAPPRSTPACACGNAAPRPSAHAIGASSGAGACVRSTLLLAAPMHGRAGACVQHCAPRAPKGRAPPALHVLHKHPTCLRLRAAAHQPPMARGHRVCGLSRERIHLCGAVLPRAHGDGPL